MLFSRDPERRVENEAGAMMAAFSTAAVTLKSDTINSTQREDRWSSKSVGIERYLR
jgi:hypothetical protein